MTSNHRERKRIDKCCILSLLCFGIVIFSFIYTSFVLSYQSLEDYDYCNLFGNISNSSLTNSKNSICNESMTDYSLSAHPVTIIYILIILSFLACCVCICLNI